MAAVTHDTETLEQTRKRLLSAAGEVFAEHGYRAATIRQISQRANANIAAVNYHFGDKQALYLAVFAEAMRTAQERYPLDMGLAPGAGPRDRLRAFVRAFLFRLLDEGRPAWQGKLMVREIADPSGAIDHIVNTTARPQFQALVEILQQLTTLDGQQLVRFAGSIIAQCVFYRFAQPVIARVTPDQRYQPSDIEALAEHITQFSLRAMEPWIRKPREQHQGATHE